MITEKQVDGFEQKAKDDALEAFNLMLETFKKQVDNVEDLKQKIELQKKTLSQWAAEANYQIDWLKYKAVYQTII